MSVGTAKKSMATVEPTWFSRNVRQVCEGGVRRRGISRKISSAQDPQIPASTTLREYAARPRVGSPGPSLGLRRRTSARTCGRPPFGRDCRVHNHAKPRRCQAMTVVGLTIPKADLQSDHASRRPTQNSRLDQRTVGFGRVRR